MNLTDLLDLSKLGTTTELDTRFCSIAYQLLHHYHIEICAAAKTEQLEILELEFYLYKSGCHEDPFTHASHEQSQAGRWYFHRPPSRSNEPGAALATPTGYRGGTRKGLDITIGQPPPSPSLTSKYFTRCPPSSSASPADSEDILRGGILLRTIRRVSDGKVISGPSLLVDEILRLSGASALTELVTVNWDSDVSVFPPSSTLSSSSSSAPSTHLPELSAIPPSRVSTMYLVPAPRTARASAPSPRVFRSPRIGLDISHPSLRSSGAGGDEPARTHPRVTFIARAYRFFAAPHLLTANGRGQTFVGVHDALVARGRCAADGELLREVAALTGIKERTVARYLEEMRMGQAGQLRGLGEWIGPKGKAVTSSVTAWLRLIGTLRGMEVGSAAAERGKAD